MNCWREDTHLAIFSYYFSQDKLKFTPSFFSIYRTFGKNLKKNGAYLEFLA